jgi:hypothetical protein
MVNPNTKAFLIAYDDMQAIYKGMGRPVWSQLGIEAKGRTRVLKVNYRNTVQILGLARRVAEEVVGAPGVAARRCGPAGLYTDKLRSHTRGRLILGRSNP